MRKFIACILLLFIAGAVLAQTAPKAPINFIIPFAAGTGGDVQTRFILEQVQRDTGATIVILNRVGANGMTGTVAGMRAAPDGLNYVMISASSHAVGPHTLKDLPYDPIKDFSLVTMMITVPLIVVSNADSPFANINELIKYARANPNKLNYAFAGGSTEIASKSFAKLNNIPATPVPYKSSIDAVTNLQGKIVDYVVVDATTASPLLKAGRLKGLAVLLDERTPLLPELPGLRETGLASMNLMGWTGVAGPVGLPAESKLWFAQAIQRALANPSVIEKLKNLNVQVANVTDAEKFIRDQLESFGKAAKIAEVVPQ